MMADLTRQQIDLSQIDDDTVTFTYDTNGDITNLTHQFNVNDMMGLFIFSVAGTTTDFGSATTPGVVQFNLVGKADTMQAGTYVWEMRRTNASNEQVLALGEFLVHHALATS